MARGRFISQNIITDRQINDLSSDTCRLAYTWMISLADCEGRVVGEPVLLLAKLFPRRLGDLSPKVVEGWILEWIKAGFIIWYIGSDGDRVIQLKNFEKHQIGLRKDRETPSTFDDPDLCRIIEIDDLGDNPDELRSNAGVDPEPLHLKLKDKLKVKDKDKDKDKVKATTPPDDEHKDLIAYFCNLTQIPLPVNPSRYAEWLQEASEWIAMGATDKTIDNAYQIAQEKDYTISRPKSLTNFIRGSLSSKNQKDKDQEVIRSVGKELFG